MRRTVMAVGCIVFFGGAMLTLAYGADKPQVQNSDGEKSKLSSEQMTSVTEEFLDSLPSHPCDLDQIAAGEIDSEEQKWVGTIEVDGIGLVTIVEYPGDKDDEVLIFKRTYSDEGDFIGMSLADSTKLLPLRNSDPDIFSLGGTQLDEGETNDREGTGAASSVTCTRIDNNTVICAWDNPRRVIIFCRVDGKWVVCYDSGSLMQETTKT